MKIKKTILHKYYSKKNHEKRANEFSHFAFKKSLIPLRIPTISIAHDTVLNENTKIASTKGKQQLHSFHIGGWGLHIKSSQPIKHGTTTYHH